MSNTSSVMSQLTLFFLVVVLSVTMAAANPHLATTIVATTSAGATPQPSPSSFLLQTAAAQTQSPSQSQHTQLMQQSQDSNITANTSNTAKNNNSYVADLFNLQSRHL